jgi:hypothetical protein
MFFGVGLTRLATFLADSTCFRRPLEQMDRIKRFFNGTDRQDKNEHKDNYKDTEKSTELKIDEKDLVDSPLVTITLNIELFRELASQKLGKFSKNSH